MAERKIAPVKDNLDKQRTYAKQKGRYKSAMSNGFYLEAIMIDYALLEDRFRSMLYHMGFLSNRNAIRIWKNVTPKLREIVSVYKLEGENDQLGIKNISGKIKIISAVLSWAENTEGGYENDKHLISLKKQIESIDMCELIYAINATKDWLAYRNEVVHALMNKNLESLDEELKEKAEEGMRLANLLDKHERGLKSGNKIRKSVNLPSDK